MHHPISHPRRYARHLASDLARSLLPVLFLVPVPGVAAELPSWAEVQCPEVAYLILDGDLNGARVQAQQGRLDCMVLVAEAHREGGNIQAAKEALADVIGFAEDPQRDTYPLLLFYKVAYLGGTRTDFSNLERRDSNLSKQAKQILLTERRGEILGYLRDPLGKDCPRVSLPFDDVGVTKLNPVCEAARAWQQTGSRATSLEEQLGLLDTLEKAYSGQVYGEDLRPPGWIAPERDRIRQDLVCVTDHSKHINAYEAARNDPRASIAQRDALLAARGAILPCRDRLDRLGIDGASIDGALAQVEGQIRDHEARRTARQRLEREIDEVLRLDMIPSEAQVQSWQRQVPGMPGGHLSQRYAEALNGFLGYHRCYNDYPSIRPHERLSLACEQLGFGAMPQPDGDRQTVSVDQAVALAAIRRSIAAQSGAADAGGACDLPKAFAHLAQMTKVAQQNPHMPFARTVGLTLAECGASANCISSGTMALLQPHEGWVWTAFADCRLQEARYKDAVENLDVAARYVRPEKEPELADLIVRRLRNLGDVAHDAGTRGFDEAGLRAKVGRKASSDWLRAALATGPRVEASGPPNDTDRSDFIASLPDVPTPTPPPPTGTGQPAADLVSGWYAGHWEQALALPYYRRLSGGSQDGLASAIVRVERAHPDVLVLMRYWDQREQSTGAAIGSETVIRIVDRLREADPARFNRIALEVTGSHSAFKLGEDLGYHPADFAIRHAIARRAIELGCPSIAIDRLAPIGRDHFSAVGPEATGLHQLLLGYMKAQPESPDACANR